MIIGIGHDLTDIRRIERALDRFGQRFIDRCFTAGEKKLAESRAHNPGQRVATYAKRFAAKEACVKALGIGVASGVTLKDIEVKQNMLGKPVIDLHGGAYRYLAALLPDDAAAAIHLSLSDEPPYASAYVVIEACHAPPSDIMMEGQAQ